ncbi:D-aminopeptidase [Bacillus pakistanensis]|uniref:D-aminopeptidase n=1 Tax=Rossellomorea pakistanensis TaxID=992288 RepID=A0ABS2NFF4_9BACI|nr:P1 family peptidase [Bacillus pakistanensis]MBM7586581.1 D-aminopeptidase [Bacillus pakistanensis]
MQKSLVKIGTLPKGQKNCLTDVEGIKIGHVTLEKSISEEEKIQTGVTAILPHGGNLYREKVMASCFVINGYGKTTGLVQVGELGAIEAPIMLTNTFSVGNVWQGTLQYMMDHTEEIGDTSGSINIVVGECNDMYLHSARHFTVEAHHAAEAIEKASSLPSDNGAIGAGTGTLCLGYKGGIGTSSRLIKYNDITFRIGALVQTNFGQKSENPYISETNKFSIEKLPDGSIMIVLATDAPLSDRQLKRIAKRASVGLARAGSHIHHGSGDIVIAFSTANKIKHDDSDYFQDVRILREDHPIMNLLFQGVAEAVEEAIFYSMYFAKEVKGRMGRKVPSFKRESLFSSQSESDNIK